MENKKLRQIKTLSKKIFEIFLKKIKNKNQENITDQKEVLKEISNLYSNVSLKKQKKIMFEDNTGIVFKNVILKTNKNEIDQLLLSPVYFDENGNDKDKINNDSVLFLFTYIFEDKESFDKNIIKKINIKTIINIRRKSDRPKSGNTYRYIYDVLNEEKELTEENIKILLESKNKPHLKRNISGRNHEEVVKQKLNVDFKYVKKIDEKETNNLKKLIESILFSAGKTKNIKSTTADFFCYNNEKDLNNLFDDLNILKNDLDLNNKNNSLNFIDNIEKTFEDIDNLIIKNNVTLFSAKKLKEIKSFEKSEQRIIKINELPEQFKQNNLIQIENNTTLNSKSSKLKLIINNNKYNFGVRISDFKGDLKDNLGILYRELNCSNLSVTLGKINTKIFQHLGIKLENNYSDIIKSFENLTNKQLSFILKIMSGTFLKMKYIH